MQFNNSKQKLRRAAARNAKPRKTTVQALPEDCLLTHVQLMPIEQLSTAPWQYKRDFLDDNERERFKQSLLADGVTPLHVAVCAEDTLCTEVCDGHHRLQVLREMGVKQIPVFHHGTLSLARRKALALRYNEWNFEAFAIPMAACLEDIKAEDIALLETLPFDEDEIARYAAALSMDVDTVPDAHAKTKRNTHDTGSDDDTDTATASSRVAGTSKTKQITCPHCGEMITVN